VIKAEVNYGFKRIRDGMDDLSVCDRIYFDQSQEERDQDSRLVLSWEFGILFARNWIRIKKEK
jgi:hypothetical protein